MKGGDIFFKKKKELRKDQRALETGDLTDLLHTCIGTVLGNAL